MEKQVVVEETATALDERVMPPRPRISWGAILGGAFSALGLWLLLYAFGLAIGLSSVDPNNPGSVRGSGIFTGVWSAITPLLALFVGGLVAGHLAGVFTRAYGALHGLVMWGLVTVGGTVLIVGLVGSVVAGAATVGKSVVQGGGEALKGVASVVGVGAGGLAENLGLDWNDALTPVNQRLQQEGKPALTAEQVQAATRDTVQGAIRTGHFDRGQFESALARQTALSRADAQDISQRIEAQYDKAMGALKARAHEAADAARLGALKAADATGKAFWGVFAALSLGLLSALGGGALGVPRLVTLHQRGRRAVTAPPPRGPIIPRREAYPRP